MKYFNQPTSKIDNYRIRLCRLLDSYVNIGGYASYKILKGNEPLLNIRASRFVRPYSSPLKFFEKIRHRRIKKEMIHAAKQGEVYHLWWHPHNMGARIDESMKFLEGILAAFDQCHKEYGMQSMTMSELADSVS